MKNFLLNPDERPAAEDLVTDWYLPEDEVMNGFAYPGPITISQNDSFFKLAPLLLEECKKALANTTSQEFTIKMGKKRYRGHKINSIYGTFYALRRIPEYIPPLSDLGLPEAIQKILTHSELTKGGLVMIAGETGQGKSTTSAATIKARLEKYASFCLTVEDPPELPLQGEHGQGRCIQTAVISGEFAAALKGAVRSYPTIGNCILYVGETRDTETAYEALVAATNGHLVFTTVHALDIISAIKRFLSLACSYKNTTEDTVRSMMGSSIRLIMHQRLRMLPSGKKLETGFLFCPNGANAIAQKIKRNEIDALSTDIETQKNMLENNKISHIFEAWDFAKKR